MFALWCTVSFRTWWDNPWMPGVEVAVGAGNICPPRIVRHQLRSGREIFSASGGFGNGSDAY